MAALMEIQECASGQGSCPLASLHLSGVSLEENFPKDKAG